MMLPYLRLPTVLPGDETKGNADKIVDAMIQPANIIAYHQGYGWGTFVYLTTGQAFCLSITVAEYEQKIKDYWAHVNNGMQKGNKGVIRTLN
jgi:hypothetical protein